MSSGTIPSIPSGIADLETFTQTMNDRIRRINVALAPAPAETAPGNLLQVAYCSAPLTLVGGATFSDIPGCSISLSRAGRYQIVGVFGFTGSTGAPPDDANIAAIGQLMANGAADPNLVIFTPLALTIAGSTLSQRSQLEQQWSYTGLASAIVKLQARKSGGFGTSVANLQSSISALWIGP